VAESEADAGNQNVASFFFLLKQFVDVGAQFVNVELEVSMTRSAWARMARRRRRSLVSG
jgi:hypothetical protein